VRSAHSADANDLLTPGSAPQETLFSSSTRSDRPRARASATYGANDSASPVEVAGDSSRAIVG
jgi:hypothetical protein